MRIMIIILILVLNANIVIAAPGPKAVRRVDNLLAVFDFEIAASIDRSMSRLLAEGVRSEIQGNQKYTVVEQNKMDKILKRTASLSTGCVTMECAVKTGKMLGVRDVVVGNLSIANNTYIMTLTVADVRSGDTSAITDEFPKNENNDLVAFSKSIAAALLNGISSQPVGTAEKESTAVTPRKQAIIGKINSGYIDPTTGMAFLYIKGGCYSMGDSKGDGATNEKPFHKVCVDDFYMGTYEVTNAQFRKYRPNHDSGTYEGLSLNGESQPAVNISWEDAVGFSTWIGDATGKRYRLPTEAEWEYAARAGTKTSNYWGDKDDDACGYANVSDLAAKKKWPKWVNLNCDDGFAVTAPVGSFKPNAFGLYDMMGNAWEWVNDWYDDKYYAKSPKTNPPGPMTGQYRVLRGGSWFYFPWNISASYRFRFEPGIPYFNYGFRLVLPVK